jgi:hypothetical protein
VILANEVSSTLTVFEVEVTCPVYNVQVQVNPQPTVAGQQANTIFLGYGPQSVQLNASASPTFETPFTFSWSPLAANSNSLMVSPQVTTTYTVTAKDENGCTASASQQLQVIDARDGDKKIFICRDGKTQSVSINAIPAQLARGVKLGRCDSYSSPASRMMPEVPAALTLEEKQATIYPNPAQTTVRINLPTHTEAALVTVFDLSGRVVLQPVTIGAKGSRVVEFNVASLRTGTYLIQIASQSGVKTQKLVVAH